MGFPPPPGTASSLLWVLPLLGTPSCGTGGLGPFQLFYLRRRILQEKRKERGAPGPSPALG